MTAGVPVYRWAHLARLVWWLSLGLAAAVWVLVPFGDREELLGNSAFALLVSAVLVNVAVIMSYWLAANRFAVMRGVWLILTVVCLIFTLAVSAQDIPSAQKDAGTVLTFTTFALSFPLGLLGALILSAVSQWMGPTSMVSLVGIWLLFVVLGYLQWFKLVPLVVRLIRERKNN
jgi:hypothetical protein